MSTPNGAAGVLEVLRSLEYGFNRRCPACAGFNVGPNGETAHAHTKTCPVPEAIRTVEALANEARNAAAIIRNCVSAGQIGTGYAQHADDIDATLAAFGSAAPKDDDMCSCASGRGAEHCVIHAPLGTLEKLDGYVTAPAGYTTDKDGSIVPGSVYEGVEYDNTPLATPAGDGGLLAIADEMTRRMAGPPLRKPVYGAELIEWAERIRRLAAAHAREVGERDAMLAQCFKLAGADADGNEDWRIAPRAVDAVRDLRLDYDKACDELHGTNGWKPRAEAAEGLLREAVEGFGNVLIQTSDNAAVQDWRKRANAHLSGRTGEST